MNSERQLELVEANEKLVMAMLQAHSERDASEKKVARHGTLGRA